MRSLTEGGERCAQFGKRRPISCANGDVGARFCQHFGRRFTDALARTADEGVFAFER